MPTYEYHCRKCDETFEVYYRSFAESERHEKSGGRVACECCGAKASAERVFSVFGTKTQGASPKPSGGGGSCCGGGGCGCG